MPAWRVAVRSGLGEEEGRSPVVQRADSLRNITLKYANEAESLLLDKKDSTE